MPVDKWENVGLSIQSAIKDMAETQRDMLNELKEIRKDVEAISIKASLALIVGSIALLGLIIEVLVLVR